MFFLLLAFWASDIDGEDREGLFRKYRENLTSGTLKVSCTMQAPGLGWNQKKWVQRIWFDKAHFRVDHTSLEEPGKFREIYCENCQLENYYVHFNEKHLGSKIFPITIQTLKIPERVGSKLRLVFDSANLHLLSYQ